MYCQSISPVINDSATKYGGVAQLIIFINMGETEKEHIVRLSQKFFIHTQTLFVQGRPFKRFLK